MFNIFEQPWTLLIGAVLVLFVLLIVRSRGRWLWLLPVILAGAAFGLDFLVQTDTEKIKAVIVTATRAVENENPDAIELLLSDSYRDSRHNTKKALMSRCRAKLTEPLVEKNITRILAIEKSGPKATALFTVRTVFDKRSYVYQSFKTLMFTKVKLDLQRQLDNRWLISRAEILEIDRQPADWRHIR